MRTTGRAVLGLGVVIVLVAGADLGLAYHGSTSLSQQKAALSRELALYQSQGLPASQAAALKTELAQVDTTRWWSPTFLTANPSQRLVEIRRAASQEWEQSLVQARNRAQTYLTDYQRYISGNSAWLADPSSRQVQQWSNKLTAATTPGSLEALVSQIELELTQVKSEVKAAQARAAANVSVASGGILQEAASLEAIAQSDNLSPLAVPQDAAALRQALAAGQPGTSQSAALSTQLAQLKAEIGLNDQLISQSLSVMDLVDQAGAEQTANAATYLASYQSSQTALDAARTAAQLVAVQQTLDSLQHEAQASLNADQCGHTTISGKSIYISLSLQEMVFYDNGCAVRATPVTTGRALLRTPTGTYHIFDKQSPYVFISPWPPGSPFWYPTSPVNWVMEFDQGGYYIHDAPWEPTSVYGPGSQNGPDASHGCVQTPGSVMAWAYSWTPMGTTVVVAN
jgi:lipoprotein-anchoring transpeptidase ErfK/SrfK